MIDTNILVGVSVILEALNFKILETPLHKLAHSSLDELARASPNPKCNPRSLDYLTMLKDLPLRILPKNAF